MKYMTSPTAGYRVLSMLIDNFFFAVSIWLISVVFVMPEMKTFGDVMAPGHEPPDFNIWPGYTIYIAGAMYALFFCKDSINGRSPGKKIMGHQVVNHKTGLPANPWRCVVRNLFCILAPVEAIVALVNPGRRIGDFVAGTEVVNYEEIVDYDEPEEVQPAPAPKYMQAILSFAITALTTTFLAVQWKNFISDRMHAQFDIPYITSSYNEEKSIELQRQYDSNFSEMLTADVRVYDNVKNVEGGRYVSVILNVDKPMTMPQKELYDSVVSMAKHIYTDGSIVNGKVQYVTPSNGQYPARRMVTNVWTF